MGLKTKGVKNAAKKVAKAGRAAQKKVAAAGSRVKNEVRKAVVRRKVRKTMAAAKDVAKVAGKAALVAGVAVAARELTRRTVT